MCRRAAGKSLGISEFAGFSKRYAYDAQFPVCSPHAISIWNMSNRFMRTENASKKIMAKDNYWALTIQSSIVPRPSTRAIPLPSSREAIFITKKLQLGKFPLHLMQGLVLEGMSPKKLRVLNRPLKRTSAFWVSREVFPNSSSTKTTSTELYFPSR